MYKGLDGLPSWLTHFLGRRDVKPQPMGQVRTCLWSFIGAFVGISVVEILFTYSTYFRYDHGVPLIIGSCGATAILVYGSIDVPLAQPRNVIGGSIISSFIGVAISRMFLGINTPDTAYDHVRWVAGATSVAITLVLMQLAKCVHPPSGATALLPIATKEVYDLGWYYIPVMVLSVTIMLVIALLINNIERRYPVYFWSPTASPSPSVSTAPAQKSDSTPSPELEKEQTPQTTTPIYNVPQIPPGILNNEEEDMLKKIYEKIQA